MIDPTPPAFQRAVADYLAGTEEQFNHAALVHTFNDIERFRRWARFVEADFTSRGASLKGSKVLCSGCGAGGSLLAYAEIGAAEVHGIEVDDDFARMSRARADQVEGVTLHQLKPSARLPFPDRHFDFIESMDVIEHVPDDLVYLRELRRVLAPGGRILLVTPNRIWPVEQHLSIVGPPWLPIGFADRLFRVLSWLPGLSADRRKRYRDLTGMRTHNMSLVRLRRLAKELDLHLRLVHRTNDDDCPVPEDDPRAEQLLTSRVGKFVSPIKSLAVTLERKR